MEASRGKGMANCFSSAIKWVNIQKIKLAKGYTFGKYSMLFKVLGIFSIAITLSLVEK